MNIILNSLHSEKVKNQIHSFGLKDNLWLSCPLSSITKEQSFCCFCFFFLKKIKLEKIRVKYPFASRGFKSLFFVLCAFIFITSGTCAMRKERNCTSVHFFRPKLTDFHVSDT
jgi:hypothetical protein